MEEYIEKVISLWAVMQLKPRPRTKEEWREGAKAVLPTTLVEIRRIVERKYGLDWRTIVDSADDYYDRHVKGRRQ